jgi:YtcA family
LKGSAVCTRTARSAALAVTLALCGLALSGCDPVINIAGADFPSWLVCLIAGAILTAILRPVFVKLRLEPYIGPLLLVYLSLALLLSCVTYLMFFNRI